MFVKKRNGNIEPVYFDKITIRIKKLIKVNEEEFIDPIIIAQKVVASIYSGISTEELDKESAKIAVNLCTTHHLYSMLAGRILISNLYKKTLNTFVEKQEMIQNKLNILDENWLEWLKNNRTEINNMINYEKDYTYDYFGFKTLERAYLIKIDDDIIERPQDMLLRVASFINNGNLILTKKTYDLLSNGLYIHASPTLFNSGNKRSQLSSCFLLGTDDSLEGITKTWADVSKISKWGGGIGIHVSNIRAKESLIRGTNGPSNGIIPMLKVYNEIARYIDQCFIGSTKIYTDKGLVCIENIKPNDKVLTYDGTFQEVERIYCDKYNGNILKININEENINVTSEHPFLCIKNQSITDNLLEKLKRNMLNHEWISIKNITNNDLICFSIPQYNNDNLNYDESDCYIYGIIFIKNIFDNTNNLYKIKISESNILTSLINYLKIYNIHFEYNNSILSWNFTSKFKFAKSQFIEFDNNMLHLPLNKLKWLLQAFIDINGENNNDTIIIKLLDENIANKLKYILLKMKILSFYKNNCLVYKINNNNCIIYDNIIYTTINNSINDNVDNLLNDNIDTIVYDLEVKNNHNYLTQGGLVHNGGKRKGSIAIYLEPHHAEIMAFLDLKKNFGAETERARDLFLAVWLSDLFMRQVESDSDWYLMCPDKCPKLNDVYGKEYEDLYWYYVKNNMYNKKIKARDVMKAILESQLETGTPYIGFKDNVNNKSNQKNIGCIKSSNLCIEIVEYSDNNEYAVCNLASIAINKFVIPFNFDKNDEWKIFTKDNCKYCTWAKSFLKNKKIKFIEINQTNNISKGETYPIIYHNNKYIGGFDKLYDYTKGTFDFDKLYDIAYIATINLNKIIDINYYPVIEAKVSNIKHRPIGLGIQGLADTLALLKIPFDSNESIQFNSKLMETIYLASMTASNDIAIERLNDINEFENINFYNFPRYYDTNYKIENKKNNMLYHKIKPSQCELIDGTITNTYSTFKGSPISQGKFQFDLWSYDRNKLYYKDKWDILTNKVINYGVRNSLVTALMPTASTSQILGNNECFEFFTSNIYTRKTLAGDFPLVNKYLIDDLYNLGLWSNEMKEMILANNGSINKFNNIPEQIKNLYKTIWEIKQIWVLKNAEARGPFNDQSQSLNIWLAVPDYQKLYSSHFYAWKVGLKTGIYYLRSKPSKDATKFTVDPNIQKKLEYIINNDTDVCENCSA